ncbi:MAG: SpoIVB peptidase S55 domain-containing protein [Candidatus Acidiferrales bacterium]
MRLRSGLWLAALLFVFLVLPLGAAENPAIFPLSDVKPGMKGVAYTIFTGDQIEKMDVTVLGVLKNAMGPGEDVILVELAGADVAKTGVVAGMSGSPVYIDDKLVGAISLKIGTFTKDAIAGVTPIQNMLDIEKAMPQPGVTSGSAASPSSTVQSTALLNTPPIAADSPGKIALGGGQFLTPIETPLVFSGVVPETLSRYSSNFQALGMTMMAGGTAPASPDDSKLQPGDMVGMDLVSGDLSLYAGCSVTAIVGDQVFVCGHPLYGFGSVSLPMTRAHVVTTLASALESTKIMNIGGTIGTIAQDRTTAVVGRLGGGPPMIPVDVNLTTPSGERHFHFSVVENPKLTPLLVAVSVYNGIVSNTAYSEGTTLQMDGAINLVGHPSVELRDMYVPTDSGVPDGFQIASTVESAFALIYTNPYEQPKVEKVTLNVKSLSNSRWSQIDGAWSDRSEAAPGEKLNIKVLLRPYRGAPFIQEIPVTIPAQASRGNLQILVSDAASLDRMRELFGGAAQNRLQDLDELIRIINRERQNDCLYVTLLQNSPTLLVEDKELPNVPASEINVLDQRRAPGGAQLLFQSVIGEHSLPMNQVISGQQYLSIAVK